MKHVYCQLIATGFRSAGAVTGTLALSHRGSDTSFEIPLAIGPDGIGETGLDAAQGRADGRLRHPHCAPHRL